MGESKGVSVVNGITVPGTFAVQKNQPGIYKEKPTGIS